MKSKILFNLLLIAGLGTLFITLKSDSNGKYNNGTTCGSCHGSKNTATTVAITGLPASFVTGQTYNLTFTVTNTTNLQAGFNLLCSAGTFTAGTGSKINTAKTQITHTTPKAATGTTTTFSFTWTAPTTTSTVNFSGVGNAVNGDGQESSADQWNTTTASISGSFPASVSSVDNNILKCYPNPTHDIMTIEGLTQNAKNLGVYNVNGQRVQVAYSFASNKCSFDCSKLAIGTYFLQATIDGKEVRASFLKN